MLVATHMLIAQKTYECLPDCLKSRISLRCFIFGNVKPDLIYRLSSISHRLQDSLPFVLDEIESLQNQEVESARLSINLGVINHFLADFFCSAHYSEDNYCGPLKHFKYELELHQTFKRLESIDRLKPSTLINSISANNNLSNIIGSLETEFALQNSSKENDIYFALRACNITNSCLLNNVRFSVPANTIA